MVYIYILYYMYVCMYVYIYIYIYIYIRLRRLIERLRAFVVRTVEVESVRGKGG